MKALRPKTKRRDVRGRFVPNFGKRLLRSLKLRGGSL